MINDLFAGAGEAAKTSRHTAGRKHEMYDGDRDLCSFETTAVNSVRSIDRDCLTSLHQRFPAECAYPASVPEVQVVIVVGENTSGESKTMPLAVSRSLYQSSPYVSIFPENFAPTVLYRLNRWINRFNSNEFFHCLPCEFPHEDEAEYWAGFGHHVRHNRASWSKEIKPFGNHIVVLDTPRMRQGNMVSDLRRCLRAAIAIRDLEIKGCDSMAAEGAFERRAAIHRFGCVISHIFNRSPSTCPGIGAIGAQPLGRRMRHL